MATAPFTIAAAAEGAGTRLAVSRAGGVPRHYRLAGAGQPDYRAFFRRLAADFGTGAPHADAAPSGLAPAPAGWTPLIVESLHPHILSGYGDPAVLRTREGWWLVATSNDAPHAFPILFSPDLAAWRPAGFVFPEGQAPAWTLTGPGQGDFWAPEMAQVGKAYWLCYTARAKDGALAIGLAKAKRPEGPWVDLGRPLLTGGGGAEASQLPGLIDSHIFVDADGAPWLFWKADNNGLWPRALAGLLRARPALVDAVFESEADRASAAFAAAILPWAQTRRPMEAFFLMQGLIDAAVGRWADLRRGLEACGDAGAILAAMRTPILAQRLAADGRSSLPHLLGEKPVPTFSRDALLLGEPETVLVNDLDWEGHLIEGPWVTRQAGRYWLFYAGNDFGTAAYGIGAAVADRPLGPWRKLPQPLLRSAREWWGPGHASVAEGPDGTPRLFFHAYFPGRAGYNQFRALLTAKLRFTAESVEVVD